MISRPRGKFIVFEGIDGCGKDTQLDLAAVYVRGLDKYNEIYLTREPTWRAPEIRKKMGSSGDPEKEAEWFARAFIYEDRVPHILEDIEPALEKGWHVLSSRFEHSTEAYQSAQGISLMKLIH
ncbi:MAG: dTMP kinase, partial [Candidatus Nanoarchaeia archaeon]